jgi:hypothetical protein
MKVRSINKLNAKSVEAAKDGFWSDGRSLYLKAPTAVAASHGSFASCAAER